jgi:TorA maturation chaperone TorD
MASTASDVQRVAALRDFFLAGDGEGLKKAYDSMALAFQGEAPEVDDWEAAEFVFNRLFVGPAALEAPPYASVYLDAEPVVMGETTRNVREMYASIGLESPWKNQLPDDHVSLELDAALAMNHLAAQSGLAEMREIRMRFLDHLRAWIPRFVERIRNAPSQHPAIAQAAECLAEWLNSQDAT